MRKRDYIDVPVRKPWVQRWLIRSLKLSLVIGIIGFGLDVWSRFEAYQENIRSVSQSETGYKCAAALSDEILTRGLNSYETIDISTLGCSSRAPFYVSMQEVRDMRAGKLEFEPWAKPFDVTASVEAFVAFFFISLVGEGLLIGLVAVGRWIWGTV